MLKHLFKKAVWIGTGNKNDKKNMLPPEIFLKEFRTNRPVKEVTLSVSAMGIYQVKVDDELMSDVYFAPGHGEYRKQIRVHSYNVTHLFRKESKNHLIEITVANGWYLGQIGRSNNNYGNQRGLIAELHLTYEEGTRECIATDTSWQYTTDGPVRYADFYNGEIIDRNQMNKAKWKMSPVSIIENSHTHIPPITKGNDCHVRCVDRLYPITKNKINNSNVYDFGQNHAGLLQAKIDAKAGDVITIRHSEITYDDGNIFTKNLRGAKATLTFICDTDGVNEFSPAFCYMGFRYAEVTVKQINGKSKDVNDIEIELESRVLSSDAVRIGNFECSSALLNQLYSNINWGQLSNFVSIPTDCPQRDERMGWTGDIAVFSETATMNRNVADFMENWLETLRLSQRANGTFPVVIPENKTYEPTRKLIPIAIWGDAAVMVPWAVYRAYGDIEMLEKQYNSMKAYALAEEEAAAKKKRDDRRYIWDNNPFQYGDWCAPGEGFIKWKRKGKYLAPMYFANTVNILSMAATELGKKEDSQYFAYLYKQIKVAFAKHCIKEDGKLIGDFQSSYACALYFDLIPHEKKAQVAKHLVEMVRADEHVVRTGFAGTPYLVFALADNGYVEDAYKLLLNEKCPGWLYTVKAGATTIWERWDALDENGRFRKQNSIANMVSFNHYAYGAVGAFFYRRILGIEIIEPGYKKYKIAPILTRQLSYAKGSIETSYGVIASSWVKKDDGYEIEVSIPEGTVCELYLPNQEMQILTAGDYNFTRICL